MSLLLSLVVALTGCGSHKEKEPDVREHKASAPKNETAKITLTAGGKSPEWLREVVIRYLDGTNNEEIKSSGADAESWLIDNVLTTDTGTYISIQIGHRVAEPDGSEPRFVTDQWIGVDSATRTIYEYDVTMDTCVVWSANRK